MLKLDRSYILPLDKGGLCFKDMTILFQIDFILIGYILPNQND